MKKQVLNKCVLVLPALEMVITGAWWEGQQNLLLSSRFRKVIHRLSAGDGTSYKMIFNARPKHPNMHDLAQGKSLNQPSSFPRHLTVNSSSCIDSVLLFLKLILLALDFPK